MGAVEGCRAVVVADIVIVGETISAFTVCKRLRPSVRQQEIEAVRDTLLQLHLQAVVTGVIAVADIVDGLRVAEFKEWTARIIIAGAGNCLVAVLVEKPMTADTAYICSLYCECGRNLMLDREIPEVC